MTETFLPFKNDHHALLNLDVVAVQLPDYELENYLRAGDAAGFKIRVVADQEGQRYIAPQIHWREGKIDTFLHEITLSKGHIAVYIDKPESAQNHSLFWDALRTLKANDPQI